MAGEKKRVSDEIVKVILARSDELVAQIDHGQSEQLEAAIHQYKDEVEAKYAIKLSDLIARSDQTNHSKLAALAFENSSELKRYRNELLIEFKDALEQEILQFVADLPSYKAYLMDNLKYCESGGIVKISARDKNLILGYDVQLKELIWGGFLYEIENRVYDFSLETRFNDAMNDFVHESKLWIRSDEK